MESKGREGEGWGGAGRMAEEGRGGKKRMGRGGEERRGKERLE